MNGKELLLRTLRHERLSMVPWVPYAGVHAGALKGYNAIEVLQDGKKLFEALKEVHNHYQPDGQPILFDLQVEAELLGCTLRWADKVPPSVVGVIQAIREPESVKKILQHYRAEELALDVELPDYDSLSKPLIEIFTVDSDQCPACGYMKEAVIDAKNHFGDKIDYVEYKIIELENIKRIKEMNIKNLPCIVINGDLKYSSIIPSKKELFSTIEGYFI